MIVQASSSVIAAGIRGDHACACAAILDHPEELAIFPLLVELAVREIAGARIQNRTGRALAIPFLP